MSLHVLFNLGNVFGEKLSAFHEVGGGLAAEQEPVVDEFLKNESRELSHVHAGYHFFKDLFVWVDGALVDRPVKFCHDKVESVILAEGTPLGVDQHVRFRVVVPAGYCTFCVFRSLYITCVATSSCNTITF